MPTVAVDKELLFTSIGLPNLTIPEFEEICFEFGVELDDVTSEREMASREHGSSPANDQQLSDRMILKIDVSANRYDLLCEEGLSRSLRIFLGKEKPPLFKTMLPQSPIRVVVKKETAQIRPYIVAAVLRNVTFTQSAYDSFIELQEKLHSGLCRRRTKVAIGTHDLDTIKGPFTYEALPPKSISFVPLNQTLKMNGEELMTFYESDKRLSKFLPIIRDSPVYPVVMDSQRTVLSLPPIINGDLSKITLKTKNVFIECTATEETKAKTVLNMVVGMFSQYCKEKFSVEQVEVHYEIDNRTTVYPDMKPRQMKASVDYINSCIGKNVKLSTKQMEECLQKMGLMTNVQSGADGKQVIEVNIPVTRSDIFHPCDIMEDVAVAYGINRIPKTIPSTNTVGGAFPLNKLSDFIRREVAMAGWTEVLPLTLCSHEENFDFLRIKDPGNLAVTLANPQTVEYQVVRTSLLTGLLKTAQSNKKSPIPWKLFEVGDVVLQDPKQSRRARNERRVCAMFAGKTSGFELIHGLLDRIMQILDIKPTSADEQAKNGDVFAIVPSELPTLFPGRQAQILYKNSVVGYFGILHPEVLEKFELGYPCSVLEMTIEPFL